MYPVFRLFGQLIKYRNAPPLPVTGTHVSHHMCLPWDIDIWMELNNGRTLTLYDLCRVPLAVRTGLIGHMKSNDWGLTVAGVSVRYRRRVRMFDRVEMHARVVGWDDKFFYLDQSIWIGQECAAQALYRSAVTDGNGIVRPDRVMTMAGKPDVSPPLPDWVANWIEADTTRPWPPEIDRTTV